MLIDWQSKDNHFLNNQTSDISLEGHIILTTSGSTGKPKWVALSKEAVLNSAQAVNAHLEATAKDIWFNPLITTHVGGLGIIARAHLLGQTPISYSLVKWSPHEFIKEITAAKATLTSLVPTHVFDLVKFGIAAPRDLRAIVVGAGSLSAELYQKARELGWNVLPSYGMSETASQVATAPLSSLCRKTLPLMQPLPHVTLATTKEGFVKIKCSSLLTGYLDGPDVIDPKQEGWFISQDKAVFEGGLIKSLSRDGKYVKIGGESVDLCRLEAILEGLKLALKVDYDCALVAKEDERLGQHLQLLVDTHEASPVEKLVNAFAKEVAPFERIRHVQVLEALPRTPLLKLTHECIR